MGEGFNLSYFPRYDYILKKKDTGIMKFDYPKHSSPKNKEDDEELGYEYGRES